MKTWLAIVCGLAVGSLSHASGANPDVFADNQSGPLFTVSDGTNLYWTNNIGNTGGDVMSAPIAGGTPKVLAQGKGPRRLRVHNGTVYWADTDSGSIRSVPAAGGAVSILATGQNKPMGLAIYDGYIYWTNAGVGMPDGSVVRVPLTGGTPEVLAKDLNMPMGLVVVQNTVYWSTVVSEYKIFSLSLATRSQKEIADAYAPSLGNDDSHVFWGDVMAGTVTALRLSDGQQVELASGQVGPAGMYSDGAFLYWTTQDRNNGRGTIMKVAVSRGTPELLAGNRKYAYGISGDSTNIYWTEQVHGIVYKLAK